MSTVHFLNHPWFQLKFLTVSPLAQLTAPSERTALDLLLERAGVFRPWPAGPRNSDRLPHLKAYLDMPGRGPRSRFCDGSFRMVHAGSTAATCRAEVAFHHGQALRDSAEPPGAVRIFELLGLHAAGRFQDVRAGHPELYRPDDYGPSQAFGATCKSAGEPGILYRSARRKDGECLGILAATAVKSCALKDLVALRWDGERLGI